MTLVLGAAMGQSLTDDFNRPHLQGGELPWEIGATPGTIGNFLLENQTLRSFRQGGTGTQTVFATHPFIPQYEGYALRWKLKAKVGFSVGSETLRNNNHARVYLVAGTAQLAANLQGYLLRVDFNEVRLFRQDGATLVPLLSSGLLPPQEWANLEVGRSSTGLWELWVNGIKVGSVQDTFYPMEGHFGFSTRSSTVARGNQYFFDDLAIVTFPDQVAAVAPDSATLHLTFPQAIDPASLPAFQLQLNQQAAPFQLTPVPGQPGELRIALQDSLREGVNNLLQVRGFADHHGNTLPEGTWLQSQVTYRLPDRQPPSVSSIPGGEGAMLKVFFDEPIEPGSALLPENYQLVRGADTFSARHVEHIAADQVWIFWGETLKPGNTYTLVYQHVADLSGNAVRFPKAFPFTFQDIVPVAIALVEVIAPEMLLVHFTEPVLPREANNPAHYAKSRGIATPLVAAHDPIAPNRVTLVFPDAIAENTPITLTVQPLSDLAENRSGVLSVVFTRDTQRPVVVNEQGVVAVSPHLLRLFFSEPVEEKVAAIVNNYLVTPHISHPARAWRDSTQHQVVWLHFPSGFEVGVEYQIRIAGVTDLAGNVMLTRNRLFVYDPVPPVWNGLWQVSPFCLELGFTKPIRPDSLKLNGFQWAPGQLNPVSWEIPANAPNKLRLCFADTLARTASGCLAVTGVYDLSGHALAGAHIQCLDTRQAHLVKADVMDHDLLRLTFSNFPDFLLATDPGRYKLSGNHAVLFLFPDPETPYAYFARLASPLSPHVGHTLWWKGDTRTDSLAISYQPPQIGIKVVPPTLLELQFGQLSDQGYVTDPGLYVLNDSIHPQTVFPMPGKRVLLTFAKPWVTDLAYQLTIGAMPLETGGFQPVARQAFTWDAQAPRIARAFVSGRQEITLHFSEAVQTITATALNHYMWDATGQTAQQVLHEGAQVRVVFSTIFLPGQACAIRVTGVTDLSGNAISDTLVTVLRPPFPGRGELLITEIMADPDPPVGLPNAEFFELYNASDQICWLAGVVFRDETGSGMFGADSLQPGEYVIVCPRQHVQHFGHLGRVIGLQPFPSLNNSGETIRIEAPDGAVLHEIRYQLSWYQSTAKQQGGWSLEMIDLDNLCGEGDNWRASTDPSGGTPGRQNSVWGQNPDIVAPEISRVSMQQPEVATVLFSERLTVGLGEIAQVGGSALLERWEFVSDRELALFFDRALTVGEPHALWLTGFQDCAGNRMVATTAVAGNGKQPGRHELLITEILADPDPAVGLPEEEFLEIHNPTPFLLSLEGCLLSDNTSTARFQAGNLAPGEHLIICPTRAVNAYRAFGRTMGIPNWPSLNNTGETLRIHHEQGPGIFEVTYSDRWFTDPLQKEGGYSLEMIDLDQPCVEAGNWEASASPAGGTPGKANAVMGSITPPGTPVPLKATVPSPEHLLVYFDQKLGELNQPISIQVLNGPGVASISSHESDPAVLVVELEKPLARNRRYVLAISGVPGCNGESRLTVHQVPFIVPSANMAERVLLSEVLFNPPPGGTDFVELFNDSDDYVDLAGWKLANHQHGAIANIREISATARIMAPQAFVVLTDDAAKLKSFYPTVPDSSIIVMRMPAYNDRDGTVVLLNPSDLPVQTYYYHEDDHFRLLRTREGVSLERISYQKPEHDRQNWYSAASTVGFATPARPNSQAQTAHRAGSVRAECLTLVPEIFTPDLDGIDDYTDLVFDCQAIGQMATIRIFNRAGICIRTLVRGHLLATQGAYRWDGLDDHGRMAPIGPYLVLVEVFDLDGNVQQIKLSVVLGGKL